MKKYLFDVKMSQVIHMHKNNASKLMFSKKNIEICLDVRQ